MKGMTDIGRLFECCVGNMRLPRQEPRSDGKGLRILQKIEYETQENIRHKRW